MSSLTPQEHVERMRRDWDQRARENARYYVNTERENWTDEQFFASGERTVAEEVLTDMINICQGKDPREMKVLEIGCGAGRVTRALSRLFGEVYGVDISGEMIARARQALASQPNAHLFQNSGADLAVLGDVTIDFAFSSIVFQHIPSREVIESYVREVHRLLRPGGLFKFQVQGYAWEREAPPDTWHGVSFSAYDTTKLAADTGFEFEKSQGKGTQYYWLWFRKPLS